MDLFTYTQGALASFTLVKKQKGDKKFNRTEILKHIENEYYRHYPKQKRGAK